MPNTFKLRLVDNLAQIASAVVSKDMVIANTFRRDFDAEFQARRGSSVNVRIPASVTASSRALDAATTLAASTISEGTQAVSLSNNEYVMTVLTDEDMNLRIEDLARQVIVPMALSLGEKIEDRAVAVLSGLSVNSALGTILTTTPSAATVVSSFVAARKVLRDMGAPQAGLFAAVSTDIYTLLIQAGITAANQGNAGADLYGNAAVLRVAGFTILESNRVPAGEIYFYHRDAVTLVLRAPSVPESVPWGSSVQAPNGVPVRLLKSWDNDALAEKTVLNTYSGTATLTAKMTTGGSNVLFALRAIAHT